MRVVNMGIQYCSSSTNTTFMFPPSSQSPLIFHQHNQPSSSWTTLPQPLHHPFHPSPPPPPPPPSWLPSDAGGFYKRVVEGLHNYNTYHDHEGTSTTTTTISPSTTHDHMHLGFPSGSSDPFRIQTHESGGYKTSTTRETADAKAVAASKSHSEAERRRRERINNHLTKLRTLLPNTTKTDKASLLAEVIQHLKDLKRQTSIIAEQSPVPSEIDELIVNNTSDYEEGRMVIRASLCCEDRSDLLPDLIRTLKTLRLRTLKAEITTLGRRVKNVLFVTGEDHLSTTYNNDNQQMTIKHWINVIEDALTAIIEKTNDRDHQNSSKFASTKRQRTNEIHVYDNRS